MRPIRTFDFIVVLKSKSTSVIDLVSLFMLIIAVVFFGYNSILMYNANGLTPKFVLLVVWIAGIIGWILFAKKQHKKGNNLSYRFALMIAAWGWFMVNVWYLALIFLIAAFIEKSVKTLPEWAFDENEIVFNSFPTKKYNWADVTNVVLKFGMLTIDFKNNKIIQGEVNDDVPKEVENEFNQFCAAQLLKQNNLPEIK